MQNIKIHFISVLSSEFIDTVLVTFVDIAFVIIVGMLFVTFVNAQSIAIIILSHTIIEVSAILLKYLPISQIHVLGFQLYFLHLH